MSGPAAHRTRRSAGGRSRLSSFQFGVRVTVSSAKGSSVNAIAPIIEAGKTDGVLRDEVTVDDLMTIKAAVTLARPENARRLAALLVDGSEASSGKKVSRRTR